MTGPMPRESADSRPAEFSQVLHDELERIRLRRQGRTGPPPQEAPEIHPQPCDLHQELQRARHMTLVGLALSGGGIRSASFSLGVLQVLASLRLLHLFDYLSTVSGGGYIAAWLAAWVKREGRLDTVEKQLSPSRIQQADGRLSSSERRVDPEAEPEPIRHLRAYCSHLAPQQGLLSADLWVLGATYLRNFLLNLLVLLPCWARCSSCFALQQGCSLSR